jgi:peptide/nickel transport system permease protein
MSILAYIVRRLLLTIPVLVGASLFTFLAIHLTPTSPVEIMLGPYARPDQVERIKQELWLDRPFYMQYYKWISNVVRGDLGKSLYTGNPVSHDLRKRLPATLELTLASLILVLIGSMAIGIISAVYKDKIFDHMGRVVGLIGVAAPIFWIALLLQLLFYEHFRLFPAGGRVDPLLLANNPIEQWTGLYILDSALQGNWVVFRSCLKHILLPAFALSLRSLALANRMMRSCLLEVLDEDYIRTVKAYGFRERIIVLKYSLKNALLPYVTIVGLEFGKLIGGTFLVESVFDWPGMGLYGLQAVEASDFPALLGVVVTVTLGYIVVNFCVDIIYAFIDPRIEY